MKSIRNTTHQALRVQLPQGKTIHLGPHKTGQISAHAADFPAVAALVEAGTVEIFDDATTAPAASFASGRASTHDHHPATTRRSRGDR